MNFSFDHTQAKTPNSVRGNRASNQSGMQSQSSGDSDRLQKAIERNRARQERRSTTPLRPTTSSRSTTPTQARGNLSERLNAKFEAMGLPEEEVIRPSSSRSRTSRPKPSAVRSRESVARSGTTRFSSNLKKESKLPAPVRYLAKNDITVKTKKKNKKNWIDYFVMLGWFFCIGLSVQLVFSERGVIDYYSKTAVLDEKYDELEMINQENIGLAKEIEKIRESSRYQKKIVRDHLGFISPHEYLLVFATKRVPASAN